MIDFLQASWPTLTLVTGCVAAFLLLRNRRVRVSSVGEILGNGRPVVVEMFSNT